MTDVRCRHVARRQIPGRAVGSVALIALSGLFFARAVPKTPKSAPES